jgi:thymidylate kinase
MNGQRLKASNGLIRYPRFNELHDDILLCREGTAQAGEPSCMVLEGVSGAGKSTLVKSYAESFPRYEAKDGSRIPVFYLETPSPVTVKGMAAHMLMELGDPGAHKGTLQMMNARLIHYLRVCEVELVILDDFHHLIDSETNRIMAQVSDWLKVLIKETGIPFLVVGIENSVERILKANQQLSRLFAVRETLLPFSMDTKEESKAFERFLEYAQMAVEMEIWHKLSNNDFLLRMYSATNGVVANVMNLLRFSKLLAEKKDERVITLETLDDAFNKRLQRHISRSPNPFSAPLEKVVAERSEGIVKVYDNRKRNRNIEATASEILNKR